LRQREQDDSGEEASAAQMARETRSGWRLSKVEPAGAFIANLPPPPPVKGEPANEEFGSCHLLHR